MEEEKNGKNYDTTCKLCKKKPEDIIHFLVTCHKLESYRDKEILKRLPNTSNKDKTVRILFRMSKYWTEIGEMIQNMWKGKINC